MFSLQLVTDNLLQDYYVTKSDSEINSLRSKGRLKYERDFYSQTLAYLRLRNDNSDLSDLQEEALRTIAWKTEWCVRFNRRRIDRKAPWRPTQSPPDLKRFIDSEKGLMDRWYFDLYGERRRPGRWIKGQQRKEFDYPSPSTLRQWLLLFRKHDERMEAFRPGYENSGNRNQINALVVSIVEECVQRYATNRRPLICDIYEDVQVALEDINAKRSDRDKIYISERAVRRRIHKISPFLLEAGRFSLDRAIRKYTPVGIGLSVHIPLDRIEMDDWEFDLQSLVVKTDTWRNLPKSQKDRVSRARCTATVAIDVATRCIVGFHLTYLPPSPQTAKAALRSIMIDKSAMVRFAKCQNNWPMYGRPRAVVTDGGPAFKGDFKEALRLSATNRVMPEMDPRMRGTIEAFFRNFKRICRHFAGQTFKDVVEKGDYPAEEMASVTFEQTFQHTVRYIVDRYHCKGHRGLEGRTPYGEWARLTAKYGLEEPPTPHQLFVAFGYKDKRVIDKHGIQVFGLSYNSKELALLHARLGQKKVDFFIDPHDLGSILVVVPRHLQEGDELKAKLDGDCLLVGSVGDMASGITLEQHLWARKEVREFAKAEQEAGRPFRLAAHRDLMSAGEQARQDAGLDSFGITQSQYSYLSAAIDRKSRAAFSAPKHPDYPQQSDDMPGTLVVENPRPQSKPIRSKSKSKQSVVNPRTAPTTERPFSSSINLYEEDE
jgi:transposase InsO family protein